MDYVVKLNDAQSKKAVASVRKRIGGDEDDKRSDKQLISEYLFGQLDGIVKYDAEQVVKADVKGL